MLVMVLQVRRNLLPGPVWAKAALGCMAISLGLVLGPQAQQDSDADVLAGNERERCLESHHPLAWLWTSQKHRVIDTG